MGEDNETPEWFLEQEQIVPSDESTAVFEEDDKINCVEGFHNHDTYVDVDSISGEEENTHIATVGSVKDKDHRRRFE
jgi:hypothetical protein